MKTLEELYYFFTDHLMSKLAVLEEQRKEVARKIFLFSMPVILIGLVIGFFLLNLQTSSCRPDKDIMQLVMTLFACVIMAVLGIYWWCSKQYVSDFKDAIIEKMVHFIDPELIYRKSDYISLSDFKGSEIFKNSADKYSGDDMVIGKVGQTDMSFSELHAQYQTRDSKGRTQYHTFFKGLFFIGDFNKDFRTKTFVLPDAAERMFGGLGTMFQKMNTSRPPLVKLEDPEFEKAFAVYGEDQVEARYVLSTSLMKRIVDFKQKSKRKVYLSFIRSKVYIAIWYDRNLFEPRVFQTLLDFSPIKQYFEDLQLAVGIVEDLNLNTRIWSKQ